MSTLSLIARFPLGVYYGHRPDRTRDPVPSPARLHAALLNAAAQGTRAEVDKDDLTPSASSLEALRWLERNPPDGLFQPDSVVASTDTSRFIYREVSSINKKRRTEQRRVSDGVAVASGIGYRWDDVPNDVAETLAGLAEDVSCLGEAHSVVVLERGDFTPNLELDSDQSPFEAGGHFREVPMPGRTDELIASHLAANKRKRPAVSADKPATSEEPRPSPVTRRNLTDLRYRWAAEVRTIDAPWVEARLFTLDREIPARLRVELCIAMHRALIAVIPGSVSPLITGKYLDNSVERLPNRLAIQYLPPQISALFGVDKPAIALFVPRGALAGDIEQMSHASRITKLWSRRLGKIYLADPGVVIPGDRFWPAPRTGMVRRWTPLTPVIPETRPVRTQAGEGPWLLADSGLLSLGFVWRDTLDAPGRGQELYRGLRDRVRESGASVSGAHTVGGRTSDYVHRTSDSVTVRAWTGEFDLGTLTDDRTVAMVGQSRHLGGGLLVPHDVPAEASDPVEKGEER